MNALYSLVAVVSLAVLVVAGVSLGQLHSVFGILIPYVAVVVFLAGIVLRVVRWGKAPVPFKIPTVSGQQKSLPWIKADPLESPSNTLSVVARMALEILFFRSLFRNTKTDLKAGPRLVYGANKWLWAAGLAFHWSFLIILLRHLRFFSEPVPCFVDLLQSVDGFFKVGVPELFVTDAVLVAAISFLYLRRIVSPQIRYISLPADYFALYLLLSIALSGVLMRHFAKVDLLGVKELAMGLVTFHPVIPKGIGVLFYFHLFFVSVLAAYFPFSKLMHMPGVFLSPTRNLANDNRMRRHTNPWNYPVKTHTYEEYEDEFREKMKVAGLPLERE